MPDRIRVACVQMTSRTDKAANLETAERLVAQAAATGADVVVLPEKWNGIGDAAFYHESAEPLDGGDSVTAMSSWARTHGITLVGGSIVELREGREKRSNTSVVFDSDGQIVATYRKIHLFDVEVGGVVYRESESEEPGEEAVVVEVEDWKLGLSVCYDVRFPELYRILALEGAQLVTIPAHFTTPTGKDHWHVLLRARAIENQLYVAACAGRRNAARQAGVRTLADRRPVGIGARAGAGRGDRHLGRARAGAPTGHPHEAPVAGEQAGERLPVADAGLTHGDWLERVPQLLNDCAEEWTLRLGEPYPQGAAGDVVRAERDDGTPVALKLIYPHREAEHEGEALRVWDGDGAERALGWAIGQTVAWMFESTQLQKHLETVRWLVEARA